ncbi:MAG: hypothetical protein AB7T49_06730 [Oligoflexales bacterium]
MRKNVEFTIQYLIGLFTLTIMLVAFVWFLIMGSGESNSNDNQTSQRNKLCWQLHSNNCF